ncbi:helix-turn-helix domain-containing protein, partial [Streptomyces sp. NPDC018000]|uniref:helix-turn-helix domain-containing protein n=1 Tax=Streptomyces sp. NPDC018000 TaxID=3365028 RepID=UPI00378EB042
MGRRENAVAADTRQSQALALWLRAQRERRGVTYAAMAKLTGHQFTASALSRGASGRIPSRRLMLAYATACDADTREATRLWKAARRAEEERRRRAGISPEFRDLAASLRSVMTHPDLIDSFGKLHDVMVEMRAREGQPSLSDLQAAAGRTPDGRHRLPKSSLSVILRGEAVPSRAHLTAFMEALNVSP